MFVEFLDGFVDVNERVDDCVSVGGLRRQQVAGSRQAERSLVVRTIHVDHIRQL